MFRERSFEICFVFSLCLKMSSMRRLVYCLTQTLEFFSTPVIEYRELLEFTKNLQSDELFSSGTVCVQLTLQANNFSVDYIEKKKNKKTDSRKETSSVKTCLRRALTKFGSQSA